MNEKLKAFIKGNYDTSNFCNYKKVVSKIDTNKIKNYIDDTITKYYFKDLLFKYIDERNLKDSDVYNKVHIDRRLFSKIRSDNNYHPSKDTIILLALSLELSEKELEVAGLIRKAMSNMPAADSTEQILKVIKATKNNDEFLDKTKLALERFRE